jgi:hypothetical protein
MSVEPLPVVRIEQMDGSHEHPNVRALRADIERLLAEVNRLRAALEEVAGEAEDNLYLSPVMVAKICRRALAALETQGDAHADE